MTWSRFCRMWRRIALASWYSTSLTRAWVQTDAGALQPPIKEVA